LDLTWPALVRAIGTVESMKSRIARILSVGGLLATATGVTISSHVVSGAPVSASASSSSAPGTTPDSGSTASSAPNSAPVTASSVAVPGSATQFSYRAGDAATLILDAAGGTLRLVTFAPHPGWFTIRLEQPSATELEVRLESTAGQVRFAASLEGGVVVTEVDDRSVPDNSVPGGSAPDNSTPGNSTPGNSTPDNSTPGNSTPDNSTPDNSTPDNSTPGNSTPGDDDGDNSGPGGGGNDDSGGDDNGGSGQGSG
jgi:hypothetical protein